ncbi:unnamed protein product, partial [Didymodactylos carnosus]
SRHKKDDEDNGGEEKYAWSKKGRNKAAKKDDVRGKSRITKALRKVTENVDEPRRRRRLKRAGKLSCSPKCCLAALVPAVLGLLALIGAITGVLLGRATTTMPASRPRQPAALPLQQRRQRPLQRLLQRRLQRLLQHPLQRLLQVLPLRQPHRRQRQQQQLRLRHPLLLLQQQQQQRRRRRQQIRRQLLPRAALPRLQVQAPQPPLRLQPRRLQLHPPPPPLHRQQQQRALHSPLPPLHRQQQQRATQLSEMLSADAANNTCNFAKSSRAALSSA